jgi:flavin reductase ActVB
MFTMASNVSPTEFRAACGLFPSGVTVVTRTGRGGRPYGMTVSSFTSVSLDPPLILVCIDRSAGFLANMPPDLPFAVNVLRENQQHLAQRFAERNEEDRFSGVEWHPGWKHIPLLAGTVASFACSLRQTIEAGDHFILLALVEEIKLHRGRALVWCDRAYHCLPVP